MSFFVELGESRNGVEDGISSGLTTTVVIWAFLNLLLKTLFPQLVFLNRLFVCPIHFNLPTNLREGICTVGILETVQHLIFFHHRTTMLTQEYMMLL